MLAFLERTPTRKQFPHFTVYDYRQIQNYYLSNSKTFQDGSGNSHFRIIVSNDFRDGNWESMEVKE